MIGLGTLVNASSIILGSIAGNVIKNNLPERFKVTIMQALGLSVTIIGVSGSLGGIFKIAENGKIDSQYIMILILSLVFGAIIGELLNIEKRLDDFANKLQYKFAKNNGNFTEGFVFSSLLYCVGAMAIVGSLEDGLSGNTNTLFLKSILDGVGAIIFTSTMGIGVAFSSLPVLIYQGSITLLATYLKDFLTPVVITQMSVVGNVLIMSIGLTILEIKKIKIGNLLPSIFIPIIFYLF